MRIKKIALSLLLVTTLSLALAFHAGAGLFFDAERYAASVHGALDCGDCHDVTQDQVDAGHHPDPSAMGLTHARPFEPSRCMDCHPEFEEELARGMHAETKVENPEQYRECIACHDPHGDKAPVGGEAAELSEDVLACMACHQTEPALGPAENALCLSCHGADTDMPVILVDREQFAGTVHGSLSCLSCHQDADGLPHPGSVAEDCTACHDERHTESEIHDPHLGVSCQACHLAGVSPVRMETASGSVVTFVSPTGLGEVSGLHAMALEAGQGCQRCHAPGNQVGAAETVLPAKSFLCMACHAATPTLEDGLSITGFAVFVLGMFLVLAPLFFTASKGGKGTGGPGFGPAASAVFFDGLLQRRLYRTSPWRWFVHALIFYPFVIRFLWGLAAMTGAYAAPDAGWTLLLIDKNNPLTALVFDLTGLALLAGCVLALVRGAKADKGLIPGLPRQDRVALGLLLAATVLGFVAEGARMALTNMPEGSGFGFVGAVVAELLPQSAAASAYGWLWYAHAAAWCGFVAYLPFSRLRHIIMAPIVLAMNAGKKHGH